MLGSLSNNRPSNDPPRVFFDGKVPSQFDDAEEENVPPLLDYLRSSYRGYPRKEERQIIKEAHVAASRAFLGAIRRDCQPRLNRAYEQSESLVAEKPVPSNNLHYYLSLDQLVQRQRATSTTTSARISLAAIPTKKSPQLLPAQRRQLNNNSTWLYQSHPMVSLLKDIDTTKNAFYTQKLSAGGPEKENPILEADIQPEDIICGRGGLAIHHEVSLLLQITETVNYLPNTNLIDCPVPSS